MFTHIVTLRVINVLYSQRQAPPHPTRRRNGCGDYTLDVAANSTSISVVHPVLSAPWAHPPSQLQFAFLSVRISVCVKSYKLSSVDLHGFELLFDPQVMAGTVNWSCVCCKWGQISDTLILKLGLLSYYIHGDEVNCTYSEECPGQHLCRRGDGSHQQITSYWIHF